MNGYTQVDLDALERLLDSLPPIELNPTELITHRAVFGPLIERVRNAEAEPNYHHAYRRGFADAKREPSGTSSIAALDDLGTITSPNALPILCDRTEITSLREWLASWGEGPNWTDPKKGLTIPIAKTTLARLLDTADYSWERLDEFKEHELEEEPF